MSHHGKTRGKRYDLILMAHPDCNLWGKAVEKFSRFINEKLSSPILSTGTRCYLSPHQVGHELHPITYSEKGDRKSKKSGVTGRCPLIVNAGRPPG
jgi:hypothetical protein